MENLMLNDSRLDEQTRFDSTETLVAKLKEEAMELAQAASDWLDEPVFEEREHLAEEMADVRICLEKAMRSLPISEEEIGMYIDFKLRRQELREKLEEQPE